MNTIQTKIAAIQGMGGEVSSIVKNYECGFITITEMMGQIDSVRNKIVDMKWEIVNEYQVTMACVDLMLNF